MKFRIAIAVGFVFVAPAGAIAQTAEEEQACMNDAFAVCSHAIPDRDRVEACLYENKARISSACRTVLTRYAKPSTNTASRIKATSVR